MPKQVSLGTLTENLLMGQFADEKFFITKCAATSLSKEQLIELFKKNNTEYKEFVKVEKKAHSGKPPSYFIGKHGFALLAHLITSQRISKTTYNYFIFKNSLNTLLHLAKQPLFEATIVFLEKEEQIFDFDEKHLKNLLDNSNIKKVVYAKDNKLFIIKRN